MDKCILCKSSKKDDIQYGEFLRNKRFGVHTFCLYLSSNLTQNGEDEEGFLGFLEADIKKEVFRVSKLKCCYCNKMYANIGCCECKCRNCFHLICGLENNAQNQFSNEFRSYCHRHVQKTKQRPSSTDTCLICYENLCTPEKKFNAVNMILTPCCRNGWFHKFCLQKFAKTAGYFFKCPLCNDAEVFRKKLPSKGIFIPNQDAAWELEPNAFAELLERPSTCSAVDCKNTKGRTVQSDKNPFVFCSTCGSIAMHKHCLLPGERRFHCNDCTVAMEEGDSGRESLNTHNNENEEADYIDVCHVSDKEDIELIKRLIGSTNTKQNADIHNDRSTQASNSSKRLGSLGGDDQSDIEVVQAKRTNKRNFRIRSETETSENSQKEEIIKPSSSKSIRCQRIESDSQESEICSKAETSRSKPASNNHLQLDHQSSSASVQNRLSIKSDSESTQSELHISQSSRKRKTFRISSDSEDEDRHSVAKSKRLDCTLKQKENKDSFFSEEDSDDDDPLEQFDKYVQKQNDISVIALRTRRKSLNQQQQSNHKSKDHYNHNNALDVSCIAKRTRLRQTIATSTRTTNESPRMQHTTVKENQPHTANRTRRKTICARTAHERVKEQQSPIYEKLYESKSDFDNTTDDESPSDTETVTECNEFIVNDEYKEKYYKFDISCVANRTRKRKSLWQSKEPVILEEETSSSSTIYPSTSADFNRFTLSRKHPLRRILSTSSEVSNFQQIEPKKFLTEMPKINVTNSIKPRYTSSLHNYHPNNRQRKRL